MALLYAYNDLFGREGVDNKKKLQGVRNAFFPLYLRGNRKKCLNARRGQAISGDVPKVRRKKSTGVRNKADGCFLRFPLYGTGEVVNRHQDSSEEDTDAKTQKDYHNRLNEADERIYGV